MAHYGLLRSYQFNDIAAGEDVRGSKIYGRNDEKLGAIDDIVFDHSTGDIRFAVVDAGGWLTSKKFLVPAYRLHRSADEEKSYWVNLDKKQIENLPRYQESDLNSQQHWESYEKHYSTAWHSGPVQHREGTTAPSRP
jgi:hypothetical protein